MGKIAALIEHYKIRIDTPRIPFRERPTFPTDYTLFYNGRTLQGKMLAEKTLTCEEALISDFVVSEAKDIPELKRDARDREKKLKRLLGAQYDEFRQAFLIDEREQIQGQFLEVKPKPKGRRNEHKNKGDILKHLTSSEMLNEHVIYYNSQKDIYVGRIEEVKQASLGELAASGLVADVVLLEADGHEDMADLFFETYLHSKMVILAPGVYAWPGNLPDLTFLKPKRPGHVISFQLKIPNPIEITVAFNIYTGDFDDSKG